MALGEESAGTRFAGVEQESLGAPGESMPIGSADVLAAAVVAGAAPLGRVVAVYSWPKTVTAAICFLVVGWLVARRRLFNGPGYVWAVDIPILGVVGLIAVLSSVNSAAMSEPSVLASLILPVWTVGSTLLALWVVGGLCLPVLRRFDTRVMAPVVALSALAGLVARSVDRLGLAVGLSFLAALAAIVGDLRSDRVGAWLAATQGFIAGFFRAGPLALRVGAGLSLLWWAAGVGFWMIGILQGSELWYGAWLAGFNAQRGYTYYPMVLLEVIAVPLGVLTVGSLVALRGRFVLVEVGRWISLATASGLVVGFLMYWMFV